MSVEPKRMTKGQRDVVNDWASRRQYRNICYDDGVGVTLTDMFADTLALEAENAELKVQAISLTDEQLRANIQQLGRYEQEVAGTLITSQLVLDAVETLMRKGQTDDNGASTG